MPPVYQERASLELNEGEGQVSIEQLTEKQSLQSVLAAHIQVSIQSIQVNSVAEVLMFTLSM